MENVAVSSREFRPRCDEVRRFAALNSQFSILNFQLLNPLCVTG